MESHKNMSLIDQQKQDQEMIKYNTLHRIDYLSNYKNEIFKNISDNESNMIANIIQQNLNNMSEIEIQQILCKCLNINYMKFLLLRYELIHYVDEIVEEMSIDDFINKTKHILCRYQSKAGGFLLEDIEWTLYRNCYDDFVINKNMALFVNTVSITNKDDNELIEYIDLLETRLNSIAKNIKVEIRSIVSIKDKIENILLWIEDINLKDHETELKSSL